MTQSNELRDRFEEEYENVRAYVELLTRKMVVRGNDLAEVIRDLVSFRLLATEHRLPNAAWQQSFSATDLNVINDVFRRIRPDTDRLYETKRSETDAIGADEHLRAIDVRSPEGEVIQFFIEALDNTEAATDQERQDWFSEIRNQIRENVEEYQEEADFWGVDVEPMLSQMYQYALFVDRARQTHKLRAALDAMAEIEVLSQASQPENLLNIFRQAFIVLVTAFDATMFDLMRVAFKQDFFRLIGALGEKEKMSLKDLTRFASFAELKESVIEEQLKTRYLKDLLFFLQSQGVECTDTASGYTIAHLVELVLRRNVHMHNRGVVDRRYLEANQDGTPRFNLYNLSEGETAKIDELYWLTASILCRGCITRVAAWVDGLTPQEI